MKKRTLALALLSALALSGCLVSDQRLPANDAPSAGSPLMGLWQSPWPAMQTKESLTVSYVPGQEYYVAVLARGRYMGQDNNGAPIEIQETYSYRAYPSKIGNRTFFSLISNKSPVTVSAIVEAVFEDGGKKLVLHEPADEAVERAFAEGKLTFRIQEDSKVATSSSEALAAWLGSLGDADFKVHQVFERWPAPVDELQKKLSETAR